jgi:hypothetical protein
MVVLLPSVALGQSAIALHRGPTVLQPCLDDVACTGYFAPQLSETLVEAGFMLQHDAVGTTAFGGRGTGLVLEAGLNSMSLGRPNTLQSTFPLVPAIARFAVGGLLGWGSVADPGPQLALGLHALPRLRIGGGTTSAFGVTTSAAIPFERRVWLGGEVSWTAAEFGVSLVDSTADLRELDEVRPYVEGQLECPEPCIDHLAAHAVSARLGTTVEPVPEVFVYARGGVIVQHERLDIALDGSEWRLTAVSPEASLGAGFRAGDRWQMALGLISARRPAPASTDGQAMTKIALTTAFRFGPSR